MNRFVFITGGSRSGKSRYAQELAKGLKGKVVFIATCEARDDEMRERIRRHKKSRPGGWRVVEAPYNIKAKLSGLSSSADVVIIDCLGLYVSNLIEKNYSDRMIERDIKGIAQIIARKGLDVIIVSNEVGDGIVPANELARRFRDILGTANQIVARAAREVYMMKVGIPVRIK